MRPIPKLMIASTIALAAASCTQATRTGANGHGEVPAALAIGDPVDCVQTSFIRNTRVHDDFTIDFEMRNGTTFRNTLPIRCPGLGFEESFAYRTTVSQLCSVDTITVLRNGSGINGPTCGLGKFVPVKLVESAAQ